MSAARGYFNRLVSRISFDRILPWQIDPPPDGLYYPKARKAGF